MTDVRYHIVEHDGAWAYKACGVYSETFRTREGALLAAQNAAQEQSVPGDTVVIEYQDQDGSWLVEQSEGGDRPRTCVDP